ncbi:hypothetical protein [Dactylosporangium sp. CA-139066]|uniref:hypothetical protein n=1 Tax=Dactylosporangium sp. CA-139066 TaxID=3239930 RepID=UPI003D8CEEC5
MMPPGTPEFLSGLVRRLRYHGLPVGVDDLIALRRALAAGFGWSGTAALRELCVMLWASTPADAAIVRAVFNQADPPEWRLDAPAPAPSSSDAGPDGEAPVEPDVRTLSEPPAEAPLLPPAAAPTVAAVAGLPAVTADPPHADPSLILTAQYPLSAREIAQAWRRLRRPVRLGPAVELDVGATLRARARRGVPVPPVLVPRYRNTARLLLLIDRQGSMAPFHGFVDHLRTAIEEAGRVDAVQVAYFHDVPDRRPDRAALAAGDLRDPRIDDILPGLAPMTRGTVYADPDLTSPRPLDETLAALRPRTAVAVISDAGAARRKLDALRLVETAAMLKSLSAAGGPVCWLNPAPAARWPHTTAGQVARHVPMFPLTRPGLYGAVEVLRGRPLPLERPL